MMSKVRIITKLFYQVGGTMKKVYKKDSDTKIIAIIILAVFGYFFFKSYNPFLLIIMMGTFIVEIKSWSQKITIEEKGLRIKKIFGDDFINWEDIKNIFTRNSNKKRPGFFLDIKDSEYRIRLYHYENQEDLLLDLYNKAPKSSISPQFKKRVEEIMA